MTGKTTPDHKSLSRRTVLKASAGVAALGAIGAPAISYAQARDHQDRPHHAAHRLPRPIGRVCRPGRPARGGRDQRCRRCPRPADRAHPRRQPNPQQASAKAERLVQRDKIIACSARSPRPRPSPSPRSSSARRCCCSITLAQFGRAARLRLPEFMFHIEARRDSMYVKAVGRSLIRDGLVSGKRWYSLTADYAFGHDLLNVASAMAANGGNHAGDDLIPRTSRTSRLPAEDPPGPSGRGLPQSRGTQITNFSSNMPSSA